MTDTTWPKVIEPPATDESAPFWDATREQRLVLPWSTARDVPMWFPRVVDPAAPTSPSSGARPAATAPCTPPASTTRPGPGRDPADGPYVVALIDLAEGARMMANVVDCPPDDVAVGLPVRLVWQPLSDGRHLPQFAPA